MTRDLTHTSSHLLGNTGRSDLLYLAIVLGVVVEELIARYHLSDGEQDGLLLSLIDALCDLCSIQETLDHHLGALQHGLANGRSQLILILHLRDTKR